MTHIPDFNINYAKQDTAINRNVIMLSRMAVYRCIINKFNRSMAFRSSVGVQPFLCGTMLNLYLDSYQLRRASQTGAEFTDVRRS